MHNKDWESMQLERFRRAAERELHHQREHEKWRRRTIAALVLLIFGGLGAIGCLARVSMPEPYQPPPPAPEEGPPDTWATSGGVIGRPMPPKPFEGQKKGECAKDETSINGGCWMELVRKPGSDACGRNGFLHEGKCYVPVQQPQRPPTSVMP